MLIRSGSHLDYHWICCCPAPRGADAGIDTLIHACPHVFLDKYIAITSFDSGPLTLSEDERETGWTSHADIAMSPRVTRAVLSELPFDNNDEWYVFEHPPRFEVETRFVKYCAFRLADASYVELLRSENRDEAEIEELVHLTERFWRHVHRINPESYIADGDNFVFATRNHDLYAAVAAATKALSM